MNKKKSSLFFLPLLVIVSLGVLVYLYIVLLDKSGAFSEPMGKRQFDLLNIYIIGEGALFYIDQSAEYALQQAIYDFAKEGGLSQIYVFEALTPREQPHLPAAPKKCGKFYGYSLWYDKDAACFDVNKIKPDLELLFNEKLSSYLANFPSNIPLNNYNYEVRDSIEIIGRAKEPLKFDILKDERKGTIKKPAEEKLITKDGIADFKDFTGTELCAKGTKCELMAEAYQRLEEAQKLANEKGLFLEVYSAYRSEEEQLALWNGDTTERYKQRFPEEQDRRKYVCNPNLGLEECPHMTGKAVDARFNGKANSQMTVADWKELEKIMYKAGYRRYTSELWHYECCGTARYNRAIALEKETGKEITAIS